MDEKTVVTIEIRKSRLPNIQFLKGIDGYDNSKSYVSSRDDDPDVVIYTVTYNSSIGYREYWSSGV
ncbi:MAG: hypothetical protein WA364_01495 [Candidatus Nitrosopolaris sp.]